MKAGFKITGSAEMQAAMSNLATDKIPITIAVALTKTAKDIQTAEVAEMARVFDKPTRWTLNSVFVKPATRNNLTAVVWLKDVTAMGASESKGVPAVKYLWPEIYGGQRNLKRFEKALQYANVLPAGMYGVPGSKARLDPYGNQSSSQIIELLSYFKAMKEQGYLANITARKKAKMKAGTKTRLGVEYFAIKQPGQRLIPGIYKRIAPGSKKSGIKPMTMFVKRPKYNPRFDFHGVGTKVGNVMLPIQFGLAMEDTLERLGQLTRLK